MRPGALPARSAHLAAGSEAEGRSRASREGEKAEVEAQCEGARVSTMLRMTPEAVKAHQERIARQLGIPAVRTVIADKPKPKAQRSTLEIEFQRQIEAAGLPTPEYDVPYLVGSRHRLDVCFRARKIGVEVQGGVHRIKGRFKADLTKRAEGLLQGWKILEVGQEEVGNGKGLAWLKTLLVDYGKEPF